MFVDCGKMNFSLHPGMDVFKAMPEFKYIPFDKIGIQSGEWVVGGDTNHEDGGGWVVGEDTNHESGIVAGVFTRHGGDISMGIQSGL